MNSRIVYNNPDEIDIALKMRQVLKFDDNKKTELNDLYASWLLSYNPIPELLGNAKANNKSKMKLGNSRTLCGLAGIKYSKVDDHWSDFDLALMMLYGEQLRRQVASRRQ
jgi:hypothetical protein